MDRGTDITGIRASGKPTGSKRTKTPKSRSRAGCLTCKQKHVKCDETRPTCHKCAEKGWICAGYSRGLKWSYKHQPDQPESTQDSSPPQASNLEEPIAFMGTFQVGEWQLPPSEDDPGLSLPWTDDLIAFSGQLNWDPLTVDKDPFANSELSSTVEAPANFPAWQDEDVFPKNPTAGASLDTLEQILPEPMSLPDDIAIPSQMMIMGPPISNPEPNAAFRLLNNWFEEVCPAWSGFDSDMNMNRQLAGDLWHSSAAVFNSLQSMSASFLSARLPQMRRPALNLLQTATICIQAETESLNRKNQLESLPTGLLFSLLCLGTTICWLDASRIGAPFLKTARSLLRKFPQQDLISNQDQLRLIAFFKNSLVYWEMLVSVVEDTDSQDDGGTTEEESGGVQEHPYEIINQQSTDVLPHPWTGISSMTSRLFARSMRLCRSYRRRITKPTGRAISLSTAMQEIEEAQRLEEQLLELDFSSIVEKNDTGDWRTPYHHLAHIAEAYQLASLLELYVTFPDLVSLRLPHESGRSKDGDVPWDKWIVPLTLRLTKVLEQIPPDSGSRVMQPLLYICASTGLRYSLSPQHDQSSDSLHIGTTTATTSDDTGNTLGMMDYINQVDVSTSTAPATGYVSPVALEIGIARNFIMRRLNVLETTLQPKPILVAEQLVKAIWDAYDSEPPGCTMVHWLDVMEKENLRSLFG